MHISNPFAYVMMKMQGIKYGKKCRFFGLPVIVQTKGSEIKLGNAVTCASGFLSNLIGLYQRSIIIARNGAKISIGDKAGMSGITIYAFKSIEIGEHTLIGANTKILDSDMHPVDPEIRYQDSSNREHTKCKPVKIGSNVFIGCNCIILKGTEIGDNCVVGAGSVVCGKFDKNCVIAGNPAKIIKHLEKK